MNKITKSIADIKASLGGNLVFGLGLEPDYTSSALEIKVKLSKSSGNIISNNKLINAEGDPFSMGFLEDATGVFRVDFKNAFLPDGSDFGVNDFLLQCSTSADKSISNISAAAKEVTIKTFDDAGVAATLDVFVSITILS